MSTHVVRSALMSIACDVDDCTAVFQAEVFYVDGKSIRQIAQDSGWQVRPPGGKGSRTAPDFCPDHRGPDSHRACVVCDRERPIGDLVQQANGVWRCVFSWECDRAQEAGEQR